MEIPCVIENVLQFIIFVVETDVARTDILNLFNFIDSISQLIILVMGISAIYMVSCQKNKWGNVVGLAHQPFWFFTTWYNEQWGLFIMSFIYTFVWCLGIYRWFFDDNN